MTTTDDAAAAGRSTAAPRARARGAVSDAQRAEVLALHASGLGRNQIAARSGVSRGTVSAIVSAAGQTFDRSATAAATEAREVDQRAARVRTAANLLADLDQVRRLYLRLVAEGDTRGAGDISKLLNALLNGHVRLAGMGDGEAAEMEQAKTRLAELFESLRVPAEQIRAAEAASRDADTVWHPPHLGDGDAA